MTLWTQTSISHSSMCAVASPKICKHRKASWIELKASLFWVVILISTCSSFKTIVRLQGCRRCYAIRVWKLCYSVHTEEILARWLVVVIVVAPLSLCYKRSGKKCSSKWHQPLLFLLKTALKKMRILLCLSPCDSRCSSNDRKRPRWSDQSHTYRYYS